MGLWHLMEQNVEVPSTYNLSNQSKKMKAVKTTRWSATTTLLLRCLSVRTSCRTWVGICSCKQENIENRHENRLII